MEESVCTVEEAAERLKLHPKTVLRFLREGRLKGVRVGRAYRIRRSDIDVMLGAPPPEPVRASVTSIVDIDDVAPDLAAKWASAVTNALRAKPRDAPPVRADVVYDPDRAHVKVVITGAPRETANLLSLMTVWLEQLRA